MDYGRGASPILPRNVQCGEFDTDLSQCIQGDADVTQCSLVAGVDCGR